MLQLFLQTVNYSFFLLHCQLIGYNNRTYNISNWIDRTVTG